MVTLRERVGIQYVYLVVLVEHSHTTQFDTDTSKFHLLMANTNKPCVYFLPIYAQGHLISMLEVAKNLLQCNSTSSSPFSINILLPEPKTDPDEFSPISTYLRSLQTKNLPIHFHLLPFIEPPQQYDSLEDLVTITVRSCLPHIKATLSASPCPVSGLVVDLFASDAIVIAHELNIPSYIYCASTGTFLSLMFHLSSLPGDTEQKDFSEVEENICVPGLTPIPSKCVPTPLLDMKSASYKCLTYHTRRYLEAKGIIVNTNFHMETKSVEALAQGIFQHEPGRIFPKIYPVGPVISIGESKMQGHECLDWLDTQPPKSVLFLCFGSMGAFEASQVRQIAIGLEQSGHRFLWVLRMPSTDFLR